MLKCNYQQAPDKKQPLEEVSKLIIGEKEYERLYRVSKNIEKHIGGAGNVESLVHCATRLRFAVRDKSRVSKTALSRTEGVITVMEGAGQIQVVIGNHVSDVYGSHWKSNRY